MLAPVAHADRVQQRAHQEQQVAAERQALAQVVGRYRKLQQAREVRALLVGHVGQKNTCIRKTGLRQFPA